MMMAATPFGALGVSNAGIFGGRELAALDRATVWINSRPLTAAALRGKVVAVDFCTYTCINWLRTLPYIRAWTRIYGEQLVVIGVHTPEFTFEHDVDNVRRAIRQMKIDYPIVVDNDRAIWRAFRNQYWPALYVADATGRVRHQQYGEGEYGRAETAIRHLLAEAGRIHADLMPVRPEAADIEAPADWAHLGSPENYLGYHRTERFASPGGAELERRRTYKIPSRLALNEWALAGEWSIGGEAVRSTAPNVRLANSFRARDLHLVMGPSHPDRPARFRVTLDAQPPGPAHGLDIDENGNGTLVEQRLYQLIRQLGPIVDRRFEIEFLDGGVDAFSFTFA
jgi:hypothetical protein